MWLLYSTLVNWNGMRSHNLMIPYHGAVCLCYLRVCYVFSIAYNTVCTVRQIDANINLYIVWRAIWASCKNEVQSFCQFMGFYFFTSSSSF